MKYFDREQTDRESRMNEEWREFKAKVKELHKKNEDKQRKEHLEFLDWSYSNNTIKNN